MLKDVLERAATELHDVEGKVQALVEQVAEVPAVKQLIEAVQADVATVQSEMTTLKTTLTGLVDRVAVIEAGLQAVEGEFNASAPAPAVTASTPDASAPVAPATADLPATAAAPSAS